MIKDRPWIETGTSCLRFDNGRVIYLGTCKHITRDGGRRKLDNLLGRRAEIGHNRIKMEGICFCRVAAAPDACFHFLSALYDYKNFFEVLSSLFRVAGMRTWIQEAGAKRRKG